MVRVLLPLLAACGRIGFDSSSSAPGDDAASHDGAAPGTIALHVLADGNAPAVGAYVLLDDDTILRTDDQGRAVIPAAAKRTFHVVHQQGLAVELGRWRVVSLYEVEPEAVVELAPPIDQTSVGKLDLTLTADGAADTYRVYGPTRCGFESILSDTTTFSADYPVICDGTTAELYAISEAAGTRLNVSQSPSFTYGDGVDVAFGAWTPAPTARIQFSKIPETTTQINTNILHATAGGDLYLVNAKNGGTAGEELVLEAVAPLEANHASYLLAEQFVAHGGVGPLLPPNIVDVSALPSMISPLTFDAAARKLAWDDVSGSQLVFTQATINGTEATLEWTTYAPPTFREVTFPVLPAELAAIAPDSAATFGDASMVALFGATTYRDFLAIVDPGFLTWFAGISLPPAPLELVAATIPVP